MDKKTATRLLHVYLYQHGVLTTANVESSLLSDPFRFDVLQFVLSQGLAQQPILLAKSKRSAHVRIELIISCYL